MAKCQVCGKKPASGNNVSFSQKSTKRVFRPNIQKMTMLVEGRKVRQYVCTRCIKTMGKS